LVIGLSELMTGALVGIELQAITFRRLLRVEHQVQLLGRRLDFDEGR